jgi:hypothetical protein
MLHVQFPRELLACKEDEFPGQSVQVDWSAAATLSEYFPTGQVSHGALPFAALYVPALHA